MHIFMKRQSLVAIGIMCGTSKDGIDVMIGKTNGITPLESIATISQSFPAIFPFVLRVLEHGLKETAGDINQVDKDFIKYLYKYAETAARTSVIDVLIKELKMFFDVKDLQDINVDLIIAKYTEFCRKLISQLLDKANFKNIQVDVIGDHGISLYHNPSKKITIQIADGLGLAKATGIFVINNFRYNDVKNGGQGAPLAPIYHQALIKSESNLDNKIAVLNLGGTANITFQKDDRLIGFDTGPANVLLDWYVRDNSTESMNYDKDGKFALAGIVQEELLEKLKEFAIEYEGQNYLEMMPPKSLDISNYRLPKEIENYKFEDACATLAAFTAYCVLVGVKLVNAQVNCVIVCGGGARNPAILNYLEQFAEKIIGNKIIILRAYEPSFDTEYVEAELMAFLAVKTLYKEPISFTTTTGCIHDTLGGHGYIPQNIKLSDNVEKLIQFNQALLNGYLS